MTDQEYEDRFDKAWGELHLAILEEIAKSSSAGEWDKVHKLSEIYARMMGKGK